MMKDLPALMIRRGGCVLKIDPPLIAAPMAGAIDQPYRTLLHENGCQLSFTEMISSRGLFENSARTTELVGSVQCTGYSGAQIFGSDPIYLSPGSGSLQDSGFHIIDLNAGCPKRKVMAQGSGGALLRNKDVLIRCVSSILDRVSVPVGIKIRSAYHHFDTKDFKDLIKDIEGTGVSYITVHPRTVIQGFSGKADRSVISTASEAVSIPVIASGDVRGPYDILDFLRSGASGVMIGRALLGDPTWFDRVSSALDSDTMSMKSVDLNENLQLARKHLNLIIDHYGEKRGVVKFRTHLGWYLKGFEGKRLFRDRTYSILREDDVNTLLDDVEASLGCEKQP